MRYNVGDRLAIEEEVCTVRYVGEICKWPNTDVYGVEWDNPTRGKNDGTVNGIRYFNVLKPHSGSFIKAGRLQGESHIGLPFNEAFAQKYLASTNESNILTQDSNGKKMKGLGYTEKVILDHSLINDKEIGHKDLNFINVHCADVTQLDLSYNLLSNFSQTCQLISKFDKLRYLDLSRNIFTNGWNNLGNFTFPKLEGLQLVGCQLATGQLEKILKCFPHLKTLDLSWNCLSTFDEGAILFPSTLKELSLSGNFMTYLPPGISYLKLRSLNLSNNCLSTLNIPSSSDLRELDISHNLMKSCDTLDVLNESLPELRSLRVNDNPMFSAEDDDTSTFYATIARFQTIDVLNGSMLSKEIRKEAELFFVSKVLDGEIKFDRQLLRWATLARHYQVNEKHQTNDRSWLDRLIVSVQIVNEETHQTLNCLILANYSVRHLKTIIARKLKLGKCKFQLYFYPAPDALQALDREFRPVNYYGICDNTTLYVKQIS